MHTEIIDAANNRIINDIDIEVKPQHKLFFLIFELNVFLDSE